MTTPAERLRDLDLILPPPPAPQGSYRPVRVHAGIAYVAGQLSRIDQGVIAGPVDDHTEPAVIAAAARACTTRALAALEQAVGLDRVRAVLFVRGFVFASAEFQGHTQVVDHVSKLLVSIFGDRGEHARSAVGVSSLPSGGLLEVELVVAVDPA